MKISSILIAILLFFSAYGVFSYNLDQMGEGSDTQTWYYPAFVNYFGLILEGDLFNECWKDKKQCEDPDRLSGLKIGKDESMKVGCPYLH